jgi:hypothetical protein
LPTLSPLMASWTSNWLRNFRKNMCKTGPIHVGAPGRLIIWRPFKPIFPMCSSHVTAPFAGRLANRPVGHLARPLIRPCMCVISLQGTGEKLQSHYKREHEIYSLLNTLQVYTYWAVKSIGTYSCAIHISYQQPVVKNLSHFKEDPDNQGS